MAKKETLKDWFSKNDGTGWVDCKTGKPCGRKSKKGSDRPFQHVDLQKHNARQQLKRKQDQKQLVGKMVEQKNLKADL